MSASIRATTTLEGNSVTLNVAAMMTAPPPPPPPMKVAVSRRGTIVTIKKGSIDITIEIPADATKPVTVNARGRVVCNAPAAKPAKRRTSAKPAGGIKKKGGKKASGGDTAAMTDPPPPDHKGS
jgi:hypothetical protein